MQHRLFVDMDGTLAEFKQIDTLETLYEEGYFRNLKPNMEVIEAIKDINSNNPDIEVFILSSVLKDSKYAENEKNQWLDEYIGEIDSEHRIFSECGKEKKEYIQGGVKESDYLLDDYTLNLNQWEPPGKGIKLLNEINNTRGTWKKDKIQFDISPEVLAEQIDNIIKSNDLDIYDMCKEINTWEKNNNIPFKERITYWFGDYAMYVPKDGVSDEQIRSKYKDISNDSSLDNNLDNLIEQELNNVELLNQAEIGMEI